MLLIFSTPELIRNLWQLKKGVFQHWCLIHAVPLNKISVILWNFALLLYFRFLLLCQCKYVLRVTNLFLFVIAEFVRCFVDGARVLPMGLQLPGLPVHQAGPGPRLLPPVVILHQLWSTLFNVFNRHWRSWSVCHFQAFSAEPLEPTSLQDELIYIGIALMIES